MDLRKPGLAWRQLIVRKTDRGRYCALQEGNRGALLTLGYVPHNVFLLAHVGMNLLARFGSDTDTVLSPRRLLEAIQLGPELYPGHSKRQAVAKAREAAIEQLARVALAAFRYASIHCRHPIEPDEREAYAEEFGWVLRRLFGEKSRSPALPETPPDYRQVTLKEYYETIWKPYRMQQRPKSWDKERVIWRLQLLPAFGQFQMGKLDAPTFDRFLEGMKKTRDGSPASGRYKAIARNTYKQCLKYAARKGHIEGVHAFYTLEGATKSVLVQIPLHPDQFFQILDHTSPFHRALFTVQTIQGLRPSEGVKLRWEYVDWQRELLHVHGEKNEEAAGGVPLLNFAYIELQSWWKLLGEPTEGWMFPRCLSRSPNRNWDKVVYDPNEPPIEGPKTFGRALKQAAMRAGITQRVTPYTLRHTFATAAFESGAKGADVSRMMRHSDERTVKRVYDKSRVAEVVDREAFEHWGRGEEGDGE